MAEIYKAKLEGIGGFQRTFAIKRILPNMSQNADYIAMLVDEAKVAGLLSHANIVQILDLGQVDGIWYIAMEYVPGRDLGAMLRRADEKGLCLPVPHSVFVTIELLKGLEYAHQRQVMRGGRPVALNIIHRDVSPPNILISFQGEVKLTDFGIARASLKAAETIAGVVKGQFDYMSPEQAEARRDLDQRSDLFTVGVVLYEMLTGKHPFRVDNEMGTVEKVRSGEYIPISQINPEVPFTLETIVDRALQVNREDRYATATAFKEALDKFFHDAGFIFTHSTLALYVKGLFPDAQMRGSSRPAPGRVSRPPMALGTDPATEIDEMNVEVEDPTGLVQRSALGPAPTPVGLGMLPDAFPTDWANDEDDAPTVIRKVPGPFGADDPTAIRPIPGFGFDDPVGDQQTVIRKAPTFDATVETLNLDDSMRVEPTGTGTGAGRATGTGVGRATDTGVRRATGTGTGAFSDRDRPKSRTSPSATGRHRRKRGIGSLGWILALSMLVLGVMAGSAATGAIGWLAGLRPGVSADVPGRVIVDAPRGTAVMLDGDAVSGDVPVKAGQRHRLEIQIRGRSPIVREFQAKPGEERIFIIERVEDKE